MAEYGASTADVAKALGLSVGRVRVLAREGRLPARRVCQGGRLRFSLSEVEAALQPAASESKGGCDGQEAKT